MKRPRPLIRATMYALSRGERGAAHRLLQDIACVLRDAPTPDECELIADIFDRALALGPERAGEALFPKLSHCPRDTYSKVEVYEAVELELRGDYTISKAEACRRVAAERALSFSRVKSIHREILNERGPLDESD